MTEYQDKQIVKELGVDTWSFIQDVEDCKVYQADDNNSTLFAIGKNDDYVSFEVYPNEDNDSFYIY